MGTAPTDRCRYPMLFATGQFPMDNLAEGMDTKNMVFVGVAGVGCKVLVLIHAQRHHRRHPYHLYDPPR